MPAARHLDRRTPVHRAQHGQRRADTVLFGGGGDPDIEAGGRPARRHVAAGAAFDHTHGE
ncbi:hypothetical protein ACIBCU_22795 [Streptomyces sp. NPDC051064]|uniref:hypothetical protein n=1 Tax=Streptomyces sp. NPDC051064 TaxID=3365641 RepID=UPI00379C3068